MEPRWSPRPAAPEVTAGPGGGRRSAPAGGREGCEGEEEEGGKFRGMKLRGARPPPRRPAKFVAVPARPAQPQVPQGGGGSVPALPGALGGGDGCGDAAAGLPRAKPPSHCYPGPPCGARPALSAGKAPGMEEAAGGSSRPPHPTVVPSVCGIPGKSFVTRLLTVCDLKYAP